MYNTRGEIRNIDITDMRSWELTYVETKSSSHYLQTSKCHGPILNISTNGKEFAAPVWVADKLGKGQMTDMNEFIWYSSQDYKR